MTVTTAATAAIHKEKKYIKFATELRIVVMSTTKYNLLFATISSGTHIHTPNGKNTVLQCDYISKSSWKRPLIENVKNCHNENVKIVIVI